MPANLIAEKTVANVNIGLIQPLPYDTIASVGRPWLAAQRSLTFTARQNMQKRAHNLSVLGPFTIANDLGQIIPLPGDKVRALLVFLAVEKGVQRQDALLSMFWPKLGQESAQTNLRNTVNRLQHAIPNARQRSDESDHAGEAHTGDATAVPLLVVDNHTIQINPAADFKVDVTAFRWLISKVSIHGHQSVHNCPDCRLRLEKAATLYRDDFLPDLSLADSSQFENWANALRVELRQEALKALASLSQAYLNRGDLESAEPPIRRQIQLDPLRETAHRQLIQLLVHKGQKSEALAQFDVFRRQLANTSGTAPSTETVALYERIQAGDFDATVRPGIRLREYVIMEKLNSGAFGSIYRAYQPSVDREVAIKVILPRYANQPEFIERLETEARFVARLEHPHIVPLYDYWRDESGAYLVMRWLRRGSLEERLKQGPLDVDAILRLLDQVATALYETHQQGVVHRDLKPGNIVLDDRENAYLTDFGIAKDLDVDERMTEPGTLMGSPAYIAPEQLKNEPATAQTDIYSLGIIAFELLTGKLPFRADSLVGLIQQHLSEPLPSVLEERPDLPDVVDWVLGRAAAKDPYARYPDVMDFAASLREVLKPSWHEEAEFAADELGMGTPILPYGPILLEPGREKRLDFVARERQLDSLRSFLHHSLEGDGQLVCVTGGAGRGKTTLIHEFTRQAMSIHQDLLVATGSCNVFSAAGDPYLPFRQILAMLTADVDAQLRSGVIDQEHARRLRDALPMTASAIMAHGPELLDVLVPARGLLKRLVDLDQGQSICAEDLRRHVATGSEGEKERKRLFSQVTAVLHAVSQIQPLILVLDDLQWVDKTSASLLYHLIRHLGGQRILIVCAYRREEVAIGRDGERHPMEKILSELKRIHGPIWINLAELDQEEEQQFVNRLLDQERNRLTGSFRQALFDHTAGHALFTVELLRAMQERGDLNLDDEGYWIENPSLDWELLPPRIEGVIEERIGRLSPELRSLLNIASVDGVLFTAEIVAGIEQKEIRHILHLLSRELDGVHRLVNEQEELRVNQRYLTRYKFGHVLIQQYLYAQLGSGERRLLHTQVAQQLQEIVQDDWHSFAAELAWHWQQAGRADQAVQKWLWLGDQARTAYAHAEAENFYKQAVVELRAQGQLELAARTLMKMGLVYTAGFQPAKAQEAYDQAFALWGSSRLSREPDAAVPAGAVLRLATEMPFSLDPGLIDDDVSTFMITQLFEGLVRVGQDQNVLPAVASRWEVLDGGTCYIFHLRENSFWGDGSRLTAADFAYAWTRNLHPDTKSPSAHLLYVLANGRDYAEGKLDDAAAVGVTAVDDHTLEIKLERPTAYLPYLMAHTVAFPLPRQVVEAQGRTWTEPDHLISNGPYQIDEVDNAHLVMSRNPQYAGKFRGNIESVECLFIDDYETVLQMYSRGQLDIVNLLHADPDTIARAGTRYGNELISIPRWSTFYLCFRCDIAPFDDVRIRQAFAHALDRQALAVEGFQGLRQAATGGFVPPGMPGYSADIALAYDPERGRELLAQAGYKDGSGFPGVEWASAPGGERTIHFLQNAWKSNLQLDMQPTPMNWEEFMEKLNRDPAHLTILAWGADIPDPENMLRTTFHSQEGMNVPRWQNKRFDELTDRAEQVSDHAARMSLYERADQILVAEETAVLPLSYALGRLLVKPWVRLPITPAISMSFRFATVVRPG